MSNIDKIAEAHWDKMWDKNCAEEDLEVYLEEQGLTLAEHLAEKQRQAYDAAASRSDCQDYFDSL